MTKQEAHLFFSYDEELGIEESWENHFFAQKQYFLTRTPIPKVWHSKLRKLNKQYEAFLVLSDAEIQQDEAPSVEAKPVDFPQDFMSAFHRFHQLRNQHKGMTLQAQNPIELTQAVTTWLAVETQYAQYWSLPESEKLEVPVAQSKAPDPMEWLSCLKQMKDEWQLSSIDEVKNNYKKLPTEAQKEVKRLTLLAKN